MQPLRCFPASCCPCAQGNSTAVLSTGQNFMMDQHGEEQPIGDFGSELQFWQSNRKEWCGCQSQVCSPWQTKHRRDSCRQWHCPTPATCTQLWGWNGNTDREGKGPAEAWPHQRGTSPKLEKPQIWGQASLYVTKGGVDKDSEGTQIRQGNKK